MSHDFVRQYESSAGDVAGGQEHSRLNLLDLIESTSPLATGLSHKRGPVPEVAPLEVTPVDGASLRLTFRPVYDRNPELGLRVALAAEVNGQRFQTYPLYSVEYDPKLERDVQDTRISELRVDDGEVVAIDERGREYTISIKRALAEYRKFELTK